MVSITSIKTPIKKLEFTMSEKEMKTFISDLQPISQQVGSHIISALQQPNTAAVLTSIVPGFPTDRIVSTPLSPEQMFFIQKVLQQEQIEALTPAEEEGEGKGESICPCPTYAGTQRQT